MRTAIIVPTCRPLDEFLNAWKEEFQSHLIIVVQDYKNQQRSSVKGLEIQYYCHADIKKELKDKAHIIPIKTPAIRSYGIWKATQLGVDMILCLDDDCFPEQETIQKHWNNLTVPVTLDWVPSCHEPTRGFPYSIRDVSEVVVSHGLWSGVPDYDAPNQLLRGDVRFPSATDVSVIPRYNFYPMCGMNVAFKPKIAPAMYFGLQGGTWIFDRYDDIWAGVISKKVCDVKGWGVTTGAPSILHKKASNVFKNLAKEGPGFPYNEEFWKHIQLAKVKDGPVPEMVERITSQIRMPQAYFKNLKEAYRIWTSLF